MRPLSSECVFAVVLELVKAYLEDKSPTLREVGESPTVIKFCGKALPPSTVHYIRKFVDRIPTQRSVVRGLSARGYTDEIVGRAIVIASMSCDGIALQRGVWWGIETYSALSQVIKGDYLMEGILSTIRSRVKDYLDLLEAIVGDMIIYKKGGDFRLNIRVRKDFIRSALKGTSDLDDLISGFVLLHEIRTSMSRFIVWLRSPGRRDKQTLVKAGERLTSILRPMTDTEKFVKAVKAATSELILRHALRRIAEAIETDIAEFLQSKGPERLASRAKSRAWRAKIVALGLSRFLQDLKDSGVVTNHVQEWVNSEPIRIIRSRTTLELDETPKLTLVVSVTRPPPL